MTRPTLDDVRQRDGQRVRLTVPKPREDQRLVGVVDAGDGAVRLAVETASGEHATVTLRERERDGVLRAFRGDEGATLIGRVKRIEALEK